MKHLIKAFSFSLIIIILFLLLYSIAFANKIAPNTYLANLNISGKTKTEAFEIINNYLSKYFEQDIILLIGNKKHKLTSEEIGLQFDAEATFNKINETIKSDNLITATKNKIAGLFVKTYIYPSYKINFSRLNNTIDNKFIKLEKFAKDANIEITNNAPKISKAENGIIIDRQRLVVDIASNLDSLLTKPIVISYIAVSPRISELQAQKALDKVKLLNDQNIILSYKFDKWTLSGSNLYNLLQFYPSGYYGEYLAQFYFNKQGFYIAGINYNEKENPILEVKLDSQKLDLFINNIAAAVDKETINANLEFDGVKVSKFIPAQDGLEVNQKLAKNLILNSISIDNLSFEKNINIQLPVSVTRATIANEEINNLGIRELIGSGVSYFAGSIVNRAYNIGLGASFINGTLVKPGEIFSFNQIVGPVSAEQGFKQAYVIARGRTVLDDGGGICQVSTTVFRAALNSGLPVVKRTAHAYRVSYYEQRGFKPGFDATIWSPTVDLKFKNDTNQHILIQATVDKSNAKLQIDIYGTRDGRRVEISDPILSNRRPAPEPKYEEDPTLPAGTTKQVDWAAAGLKSVFTRKVYKDDKLIIDDTFKSNFRPWQAVYLVGTGG